MKKHKDFLRFAKDGKSIQEIAKLLGYKDTTDISRVLKKNNQPVRRLYKDGTRIWYLNGKLHREDGPAIEFASDDCWWYLHGKRHREDGPAIEDPDGRRRWFWRGKELKMKSQEEFKELKPLLMIQDVQES